MFFRAAAKRIVSVRDESPAELIVILGGVYQARLLPDTRGGLIEATAGDVVCWTENCRRREESPADAPPWCLCIYFRWSNPPAQLPVKVHDRDGLMRILADRLLSVHTSPDRSPPVVLNALLAGLLGEYVRLAAEAPKNIEAQVIRSVEEHMTERTRIVDLARAIGLNKHHLGRKYKAATGRTVMQDVRRRKLERATTLLLRHPDRRLKEVAARTGIADEHQLSRLLKHYEGLSVRTLRRASRSGRSRGRGR